MRNLIFALTMTALAAGTAACHQGLSSEETLAAPQAHVTDQDQNQNQDDLAQEETGDQDSTITGDRTLNVTDGSDLEITQREAVLTAKDREMIEAPRYPKEPINTAEERELLPETVYSVF